jgi:hypothetical protein
MKTSRGVLVSFVCCGCAAILACGGGSGSSSTSPNTITTSGTNVASISVNSGPTGNYPNGVFASVTVCVPGTSNCQTIDNVLVDTGSSGLRVLSSALTLSLPQQDAGDGNPVLECFPFVSGYTWGPVVTADVEIAGEKASSAPVEVIGSSVAVPSDCTNFGLPPSNSLDTLLANGIVGVGLFAQDCGAACDEPPATYGTATGNPGLYYECPSSGCTVLAEGLPQQVVNPVTLFGTDSNGVIVELPSASGPETSVNGSLVFGIGTETNNALNGATVYSANDYGTFTTTFNGQTYSNVDGGFIDSGSNGYFFPDSIAQCGSNASGFYCPSSTLSLSATNQGVNGTSGTVNFSIANADNLFANSADGAFPDLGGTYSGGFDWGLPFFFGQNVYVAIQGQNAPGGTAPYWAY